jgi:CubicO group peptidase (beta-lactamase class C family)
MLAVLITALLLSWIFLGVSALHTIQSGNVPIIITSVLLAVTAALVWLVGKYLTSFRKIGSAVAALLVILAITEATWALSAPQQALFLARDIAWDGAGTWDYTKYPQGTIANPLTSSPLTANPSPQLFETISYESNGQAKEASFDEFLNSTRTTSFIVVKNDSVLLESYANGFSRDSIITSFSTAKSFTSALVGIAIDEGYIKSVNDLMVDYLPELRGKGFDSVTVKDLLTMSAGIKYTHQRDQSSLMRMLPFNDDTLTTCYPDFRSMGLSIKPDGTEPGTVFEYNTYPPILLGMILERTTHQSVSEYLQEKIWKPIGMEYPASWSLDSVESGFEQMAIGINARAIDYAKFGLLLLNEGNWNGRQIISSNWVTESTSPDPADNRTWKQAGDWKSTGGYYKYFWWGLRMSDGSYAYTAIGGNRQQWIFVSPEDQVVIFRSGLSDGGVDWWPGVFENIIAKSK